MKAIFLHIKGNAAEALAALDSHGIHPMDRVTPILSRNPPGMRLDYVVSDIAVKTECEPGVMRWFAEPPSSATEFPIGALLHYSDLVDDTVMTRAEFQGAYSRWRHGGWYVHNVVYPSGAIGCVSNNYLDRKWRIACDPRPFNNQPTFDSRDDAAYAEHILTKWWTS